MATATKDETAVEKKARQARTAPPSIDFGAVKATASTEPVVQVRGSILDDPKCPVMPWLTQSWEKRETVTRGGVARIEGAAVDLSPMTREQADYIKRLMSQGVQRLNGVGVKFAESTDEKGLVTVKFQTRERKAKTRSPKA